MKDAWVTPKQAALLLGINPSTVYRLIKSRDLVSRRIGGRFQVRISISQTGISTAFASEILGLGQRRILDLIYRKELSASLVGGEYRILHGEIERYAEKNKIKLNVLVNTLKPLLNK